MLITQPWALYNEIDEYAAEWLENLIRLGAIAPGIVDRRSIEDLRGNDLRGFRQCHFFAGIGVWSYSLRRAGISDDTAVWTGSCPCQPFSTAGQGAGMEDERHLWPAWFHLIGECCPDLVFGEQVASKDGLGWLDLVCSDMEAERYAIGPVDTCSAGSGAPHIRQRIRFAAYNLRSSAGRVANNASAGLEVGQSGSSRSGGAQHRSERLGATLRLDDSDYTRLEGLGHGHCPTTGQRKGSLRPVATTGGIEWVGDTECDFSGWRSAEAPREKGEGRCLQNSGDRRFVNAGESVVIGRPGPTNGFWRNADWLFCRDGKWRPTGPSSQQMVDGSTVDLGFSSTFPLVKGEAFKEGSGHPVYEGKSRQGMLKGYGNAVDAEATTDFLVAAFDAIADAKTRSALFADL